ncbi:hypothetical protein [Acetobacter indonesiensis]
MFLSFPCVKKPALGSMTSHSPAPLLAAKGMCRFTGLPVFSVALPDLML